MEAIPLGVLHWKPLLGNITTENIPGESHHRKLSLENLTTTKQKLYPWDSSQQKTSPGVFYHRKLPNGNMTT